MLNNQVTPLLTAALVATALVVPPPALARDLVKETAQLALQVEDPEAPPKSRSELLGQQEEERQRAEAEAELARKQQQVDTPYYRKWWFWALSAAVVGGTVALGVWAVDPGTKPANACPAGVLVCFGDGRMEVPQ